jgi:cell volume regulation protein A
MTDLGPTSIALLFCVCALLILTSVMLSGTSDWAGIPVVLPFLALGLVVGSTGLRPLLYQDYEVCFRLGTLTLVLILFDGGLNTPIIQLREAIWPAALLATVGVIGTMSLFALCARLLNCSWTQAFLLGAIVSSTDAAAVFPILRSSGLQLRKRVLAVLELESGLNDPIAVTLTVALTASLSGQHPLTPAFLAYIPEQLAIGALVGAAVGYGGRWLILRARPVAGGLYPLLTLALALLAFGLPALAHGSGFLGAYVAGAVLGNGALPYRGGILRVHDSLAWLGQVAMYLLLGLLAAPLGLLKVAPQGIILGLALAVFARPLAVTLCVLAFRYPLKEVIYLGWVGLRGAVPIILSTYPVLAQVEDATTIFHIVFFVVLVNSFIPGATVRWLTRRLGLKSQEPAPAPALLEVISTRVLTGAEIVSFSLEGSAAACGAAISELPFPPDSAVILLIRDGEMIAPKGATVLSAGDHIYVLCQTADRPFIQLIFGRSEAS